MLKPIKKESNRVADGRRYAARSIVLTNLSAIECYAYRREVEPVTDTETRNESVYVGAMVLSSQEEHATKYVDLGYAKMLFDRFTAGSIHNDADDLNIGEAVFNAQIEPFDIEFYESPRMMIRNEPDWTPKKGDIFALIIDQDTVKWLECVGVQGHNLQSDYGATYVLNYRDNLDHLEPFIDEEDLLKPQSNIFPLLYSELSYSNAPLFEVHENDPSDLSDNDVIVKKVKPVNAYDSQLQRNLALLSLHQMTTKTNSPFTFLEDDLRKITVSLEDQDTIVYFSDLPIHAVEANGGFIGYLPICIDNKAMVLKIDEDLAKNKPVKISHQGQRVFDILPINYDPVRAMYIVVLMVNLAQKNDYQLMFDVGETHDFSLDLTNIQGV